MQKQWCKTGAKTKQILRAPTTRKTYIFSATSVAKYAYSMFDTISGSNIQNDIHVKPLRLGHRPKQNIQELNGCVNEMKNGDESGKCDDDDVCTGCVKRRFL